jgi:hypothetical protein
MRKSEPLWGRTKDAYLRRVISGEAGMESEAAERALQRLRAEVAQIQLRAGGRGRRLQPKSSPDATATLDASLSTEHVSAPVIREAGSGQVPALPPESVTAVAAFDPYVPNVIVVVRTAGREAALEALAAIDAVDDLKLLAREQQLSIDQGLTSAGEIRLGIVAAAERRIANRRAAAR